MTKLRFATTAAFVAALGLILGEAASAVAGCDFNVAPARGVKADMVRAFQPCPGTERPYPDASPTSSEADIPACTPVLPAGVEWWCWPGMYPGCGWHGGRTVYSFGPKGRCRVSASGSIVADCSTLTASDGSPLGLDANPCHVMSVTGSCNGILESDGFTRIGASDAGFRLYTLTRATFEDRSRGDMTVIDFPVTFNFETPRNGRIALRHTSAEALAPLVGTHNADIPPCASLEFVHFEIQDPSARPFAVPGGATRP